VQTKLRFPLALVVAAIGLFAGFVMVDRAPGGFGTIRLVPDADPVALGTARPVLSDRLAEIHRALVIRPEQEGAWRSFADAMFQLDHLTREFERLPAARETLDETRERTRHALILGYALGEIEKSLSPEQFVIIRRATDDLTSSVICRGLASS